MRLDVALIARYPQLSRRKARDVIEKGQVSVDGERVREAGRAVAASSQLRWNPHLKALPRARLSLPCLYQDDALLIVDKPAGLLSVPSGPDSHEDTVAARVREYAMRLRQRPYVRAVHRLDRDTSGALCLALGREAAEALIALFRDHHIERRYHALVEGAPGAERGRIDAPLHDAYVAGRRRLARPGEAARPARTHWRVLERFAGAALLELQLDTGRQHQIRLHLAHAGMPVLGDLVYRARHAAPPIDAPRQMLHASALAFTHPLTRTPVRAESPLPRDFLRVLDRLRRGARGPRRPR